MDAAQQILWDRWRLRRDDGAFGALVGPHLRFASAFARRVGLGDADADDVVQQALVRLSVEKGERPARVGLRAWLGREVLQGARKSLRSEQRREAHEGRAITCGTSPTPCLDVHEEVEHALSALDEKGRRAIELRFLYDLEYREIAHILGISALACRLRVHRALSRLRQGLGPNAAMRLAAIPLVGFGSGWRSLADGLVGSHAATATVAGGTLLMGVSLKVVAVAAVLAVGVGIWAAWPEPPQPRATPQSTVAAESREGVQLEGGQATALAAAPQEAPAATAGRAAQAARGGGPPLETPIPAGKGSVSGRLVFDDGAPVAGIRLALSGSPNVEVVTGDDGQFHIHGDWVGSRTLHVVGDRRYELGLAQVALVADTRIEFDFKVQRGVTLTGTLRAEATQEPISGVLVVLRRRGANMTQAGYGWIETDEAGQFRFEHLPVSSYLLQVDAAAGFEAREFSFDIGLAPLVRAFPLRALRHVAVRVENVPDAARGTEVGWHWESMRGGVRPSGKGRIDNRGELKVGAPPAGTWILELEEGPATPSMRRSGVVVGEDAPEEIVFRVPDGVPLEGILRDGGGQVLAGANLVGSGDRPTVTDHDGKFRFPWVAAGPTAFRVREDRLAAYVGSTDVPRRGSASVDLTLPGRGEVRFRVVHAGDVTSGVASLRNSALPVSAKSDAWPDARGEYRFRYVAAGEHTLRIFSGSGTVERRVKVDAEQIKDLGDIVFLEPIDVPVELVLPAGSKAPASIYVGASVVEDDGRSSAALGAQIIVLEGGKTVLRGLAQGNYRIRAAASGYRSEEIPLRIEGPNQPPTRIELTAAR